jgi:hypothetical protein
MATRHGHDPRWRQAHRQSGRIARLLADEQLRAVLMSAGRV